MSQQTITQMLIWCLKNNLKIFNKWKFLFTKIVFELVHCNTLFFSFKWMCWWGCQQLKTLLPIQVWCLLTSVSYIDSHTFHESCRTFSNYQTSFKYIPLVKPLLMIWKKVKSHDEVTIDQRYFYTRIAYLRNRCEYFSLCRTIFK